MLKRSLIVTMILGAAFWSATSGSASKIQLGVARIAEVESSLPGEEPTQELREDFQQTYPLSANGRLSLENLNGGVRIAVWDRAEVQVNAVKRAYKRERLNEAKIEVNATADAIRIKTTYPDWDQTFTDEYKGRYNNPALVDYTITVPRNARLESVDLINGSLDVDGVEGDVKASSVNGRVTARGLAGEAKLSTVNGSLEATFTKLNEAKPITLGSVNGNVTLIIPSDANAVVRAGTVHGAIQNEFGLNVQHGEYVGHELNGQLGAGGPRIKLGNVNGRISIKHAQDGRPISPGTSLLTEKDKDKNKNKNKNKVDDSEDGEADDGDEDAQRNLTAEQRAEVREARRVERAQRAEAAREARQMQVEVQREVEQALREAQREIEQAQREIERETQRATRERVRREVRGEGEGIGEGKGSGRGHGYKGLTQSESKSFSVAGSPRVNIVTFDGAVTVHGWDKPEVMYTATKRGSDEQELKQIVIQTEQQGSSVSIIAKAEESNGAASLDVYVPRNSTLHVSSGDGELNLEGVSGELTLRTGDGSIKVNNGGGQLQVNTGDGEIQIASFEGKVDARTGDGSISLDGKFTGLAARTGDGNISLSVPGNSDFTIETNAEGIDNSGMTIAEDIAPSKRVRRWRVGRGGNVFVLNTGDGRIALNSR
ncbi:MAG: DUF4097 family beta strand repeat-containing protein [Pyrinomonadaceae bacterium]|nr:DUF4097 family beta strand repeat-containing protein [Pyrinomonadaceae bacterium]